MDFLLLMETGSGKNEEEKVRKDEILGTRLLLVKPESIYLFFFEFYVRSNHAFFCLVKKTGEQNYCKILTSKSNRTVSRIKVGVSKVRKRKDLLYSLHSVFGHYL